MALVFETRKSFCHSLCGPNKLPVQRVKKVNSYKYDTNHGTVQSIHRQQNSEYIKAHKSNQFQ